jgi:hypothetical protein
VTVFHISRHDQFHTCTCGVFRSLRIVPNRWCRTWSRTDSTLLAFDGCTWNGRSSDLQIQTASDRPACQLQERLCGWRDCPPAVDAKC